MKIGDEAFRIAECLVLLIGSWVWRGEGGGGHLNAPFFCANMGTWWEPPSGWNQATPFKGPHASSNGEVFNLAAPFGLISQT